MAKNKRREVKMALTAKNTQTESCMVLFNQNVLQLCLWLNDHDISHECEWADGCGCADFTIKASELRKAEYTAKRYGDGVVYENCTGNDMVKNLRLMLKEAASNDDYVRAIFI
jgi:hypothetical protein